MERGPHGGWKLVEPCCPVKTPGASESCEGPWSEWSVWGFVERASPVGTLVAGEPGGLGVLGRAPLSRHLRVGVPRERQILE